MRITKPEINKHAERMDTRMDLCEWPRIIVTAISPVAASPPSRINARERL
jgi:hypothetical protein